MTAHHAESWCFPKLSQIVFNEQVLVLLPTSLVCVCVSYVLKTFRQFHAIIYFVY